MCVAMMLVLTACGVDDLFDNKDNNGVKASETMVDKSSFYGLGENEAVVISDMFELPDRAKKIDGEWFLSINSVTGIDNHFYWNAAEEQMIVTTADSIAYYWPDVNNSMVNDENVALDKPVIRLIDGNLYVGLELMKEYAPVVLNVYEEPSRIMIWTDNKEAASYKVTKENAAVRISATITADILEKAAKDEILYKTGEETSGFIPVVTNDGYCGYVASDEVAEDTVITFESDLVVKEYTHNLMEESYFTAVWHNMIYAADGSLITSELDGSEGVDVIIPTWYRVIDIEGNISSNASYDYVSTAHSLGMEVWGLVDDFADGVPGIEVLSSTVARNNLADSLVESAIEYELDGINVDFEYITGESAPHYIQFLRELYLKMKPYGLKLSVDNYVPDASNTFYDLTAQAEVADYVMLMTYDEHYSPAGGVGSVASIGFVENGVKAALEKVPANRLVMGIPFYTRLWETDAAAQVTMQVLTMQTQNETIEHYGLTPVWDDEAGQYYVSYVNDDGLSCEMWLEEVESVRKKREVCNNYGLAGTASWCLGYEESEIWDELK